MRLLSLVALSLILQSCATGPVQPVHQEHNVLIDQILRVRPGHQGLTNRICKTYVGEICMEADIKEYSFEDEAFRKTVNDLGFICKVGEKRFKVCTDKPGLCRHSWKKTGFMGWGPLKRDEAYIPSDPIQYLIDAKTVCFQKDRHPFYRLGNTRLGGG